MPSSPPYSRLRQQSQVHNTDSYDDTLLPGPALEGGAEELAYDLNAIRSQVKRLIYGVGIGNWYDDPGLAPANPINYFAFLLDNEPIASTGTPDAIYTVTYSGIFVTKEEWFRDDATLIKSIDYTYVGIQVTQEVRKVFLSDGATIAAQVTWTYSYSGIFLTGGTMTRDV
jgi:hypothetical protein